MSIEFEEYEDPLCLLGALIILISSSIILVISAIGMGILGGATVYNTNSLSIGYNFVLIFILSAVNVTLSFFGFFRNWIKYKINLFIAAVLSLVLNISIFLTIPGEPVNEIILSTFQIFIWSSIGGTAVIFISKRPNLGKESNKHMYQAYGAVIEVVISMIIIFLGIYVLIFNLSDFAGNGTYPGGMAAFEADYISEYPSIQTLYEQLRVSGIIIIIGALIVCAASVLRSIISLKIAALVIIGGIITCLVGLSIFFTSWTDIDGQFYEKFDLQYEGLLKLPDQPWVINLGIVTILLSFIGLFMILYASTQEEPLEKWRYRRNQTLAAAEVAIRDQKLTKGIKYLEQATIFSSKLGEEDRAVELITRINNIKAKAIKMRKSEAAEKKKKELEKAKKKAIKKPKEVQKAVEAKKEAKGEKEE